MRSSMRTVFSICVAAVFFTVLGSEASTALGDVNVTGDVSPGNPSAWTSSTWVYIGRTGAGDLTVDGDTDLVSYYSYLGQNSGSTGSATVSGSGTTWASFGKLYVGDKGEGTLEVTDGGAVSSVGGYIGSATGSRGDVTISGPNTTWTNSGWLIVANRGDGTLEIANGAAVSSQYGFIGFSSGSTGSATVSGAGSTWTSSEYLSVKGTLDITGGGAVSNAAGYINSDSGSAATLTVSGPGSTWTSSGRVEIGRFYSGILNIDNGGLAQVSGDTFVGRNSGPGGAVNFDNGTLTTGGLNAVLTDLNGTGTINTSGLVTDMDLVFDTARGLTQTFKLNDPGQDITINLDVDGSGSMGAGYAGDGSTHISGGLTVQSTNGYIGYHRDSAGVVTVSGRGSTWTSSGEFYVGVNGSARLDISDGATVTSELSRVNSLGSMRVNGAGSTWIVSNILSIRGRMEITNGGTVSHASSCDIGNYSNSTGAVTVSGEGSTWTNSGLVNVNGTLDITNGATVSATRVSIYNQSDFTGAATVGGAGATLISSEYISVGALGTGSLDISDGGAVTSAWGSIGTHTDSSGTVTVSGIGSTWTNSGNLTVSHSGDATMEITDGGTVSNTYCYIGYASGSTGAVTVRGAGSTWTNSSWLRVGSGGDGTLSITNGGLVSIAGSLTIDHDRDGGSFVTMATGGMLAINRDAAGSLSSFLAQIGGTDDIRFWDDSVLDWAHITGATTGEDYTLTYMTEGDLEGYTVLTVTTIPEPATMTLLALGGLAVLSRRSRQAKT